MYKLILAITTILFFASCEKETRECPSSSERTFAITGFNRISAGETFGIDVKQGATFSIKAKGCSNDLNDLDLSLDQTAKILSIKYDRYRNDRYRVDFEITMPVLSNLTLSGAATSTVNGFAQQAIHMRTVLSGTAKCTVNQMPIFMGTEQSGESVLNLSGSSPELVAKLSGNSRLNAYTASFDDADVYTSGTAKVYLQVQNYLYANASGDSRVYYKGRPANVTTEQSGSAKVIHE